MNRRAVRSICWPVAVATAERLDEQSDALIGHFVDQARRSGASWSQIGLDQYGAGQQAVEKAFGFELSGHRPDVDASALRQINFGEDGKAVLRGTLKAVLRLGHNYVGTEHLLLGTMFADGSAAATLVGLGVTTERVEAGIAQEIARIQAGRTQ